METSFARVLVRLVASLFALVATAAHPSLAHAKSAPLDPGKYVCDGGAGDLTIASHKGGQRFEIEVVGNNGSGCGLSGEIKDGIAHLTAADQVCRVRFAVKEDGVDVRIDGDQEPCSFFCGAWHKTGFEGFYRKSIPGCRPKEVEAERARFKKSYDKKAYAEARDVLRPVLDRCERQLHEETQDWIRNDLAITYHKLGDDASCLKVLEPLTELAKMSDAEIESDLLFYGKQWVPIAKAARHNLEICSK